MSEDDNKNSKNYYLGLGLGIGLLVGALIAVILGIFFESSLIWGFVPAFGMFAGIIIGIKMDSNKTKR